ncbi:MAG: RES domain-containing protein [Chloroflexia bacterium]|nr:RES domain-containing protein [Chloroflexia bacterium]
MAAARWIVPWIGAAYRHIRAGADRDPLDFMFAGAFARNRWNVPRDPTLYLAGDLGVLIAEWGRQLSSAVDPEAPASTVARDVSRFQLRLEAVIDVRDPAVTAALGRPDAPHCFLDREIARSTARYLRETTPAQALLVPSIAFLDDLTRWNLVVFLDKLPADPHQWVHRIEPLGPLRWR